MYSGEVTPTKLTVTPHLLIKHSSAEQPSMSDVAVQVKKCQWSMRSQSLGPRAMRRPPSHKLYRSAAMLAEHMPDAIR